ncbi:recombinase RecX [Bacteroidia bacterium]|nr:recombinase RecX [Bacteroidia bacterium]
MDILAKIQRFCSYQERSTQEVRTKLYAFSTSKSEIEKIIAQLQDEGFINEERYATSFVRGKLRINKWGKIKISQALKQKDITSNIIKAALESIDENEYVETLRSFLYKQKSRYPDKQKLVNLALSHGFEYNLIEKFI